MTATPPPPGDPRIEPLWPTPQQPEPQGWQPPPPPQQGWQQPAWPQQPAQQGWSSQPGWQPAPATVTGWQPQAPVALASPPAGYPYQAPVTGEFGYQYQPMPQYPPLQLPPPGPPQRRRISAWIWVVAVVLVLAVATVAALPALLDPGDDPTQADPTPTGTGEPTDGLGQPNTSASGEFTGDPMISGVNAALAAKDRDAFFRFVEGDARRALNLWWDNMDVLGWTAGAFSVAPGQSQTFADDTITLRVTLGAVTAGSPVIPEASDHPDAGLAYAPSNIYYATIHVTDDGAAGVITDWELVGTAAPWDLEPLYAVVGDHSVVAGYADERDLVDRVAPLGDQGAAWVIQTYEDATGTANAQRFTTFVTEDAGRFNDWFIEDTSGWVADRSGTMFVQRRPFAAAGLPDTIAVGPASSNAGGILTIGPNGLLYGDEFTLDTIVHEFVHAMHTTNVPVESWPGSTVMEGWATYNESLFRGDGEFAIDGTYVGHWVRQCVTADFFSGQFPTQSDFSDVETVNCAYMLSGSMFAYAASLGVDVYAVADQALQDGLSLPEAVAASGGPVIDQAGWWSWVQASTEG